MAELIGALDQGTTSTRFLVFDASGNELARAQLELRQVLPGPGLVEHDPLEILAATRQVVAGALAAGGIAPSELAAIGIANQRETVVAWDSETGLPYCNAIVWQDTRTDPLLAEMSAAGETEKVRRLSGLHLSSYFSAPKLCWLLRHVEGVAVGAAAGRALFGTVDSWLVWNLTGGRNGGRHVTDVTNASRTMLMDLGTRRWSGELCALFGVPEACLPEILPSASATGYGETAIDGEPVRLAAAVGDQQAALLGQACLRPGETKNTYGTGNFLLAHTGAAPVESAHGLLTTAACQLEGDPPAYALEGSVAVTGAAAQWLRDQLGVIGSAAEVEALARQVADSDGVVFVPAFSGLFAPYWRPDARGLVIGLTRSHTRAHLARATLEAACFQSRDVIEAMAADSGVRLAELRVDGGMTANSLLLQLQADILGVPVVRPAVTETTALGAAYAAGCAVGLLGSDDLRANWREGARFEPAWSQDERDSRFATWHRAVERSLDWADPS